MGYRYLRSEFTLRNFERFTVRGRGKHSPLDLEEVIRAWLLRSPGRKPVTLADDLGAVRQLCLYLRRSDPTVFVPPVSLAPQTASHYVPYVFSVDEIRRLIRAAERYQGHRFWPGMFRAMLIATYCTGLRLGEAVRLQRPDLDQQRQVLHILGSKGRSRDVPFQADLAQEFARYLRERGELLCARDREGEAALFVGRDGHAVSVGATSCAIRLLLRRIGMKSETGRCGPRPYDLRHAFAVHRLTAWYRDGVDLQARLPWLSAYMGHLNVLGTEVYLHATPELLAMASDRFAAQFARPGEQS
ncbi:MAG: tyrosine-type recombinase/integrase [Acetobacteraceae bacterium]